MRLVRKQNHTKEERRERRNNVEDIESARVKENETDTVSKREKQIHRRRDQKRAVIWKDIS